MWLRRRPRKRSCRTCPTSSIRRPPTNLCSLSRVISTPPLSPILTPPVARRLGSRFRGYLAIPPSRFRTSRVLGVELSRTSQSSRLTEVLGAAAVWRHQARSVALRQLHESDGLPYPESWFLLGYEREHSVELRLWLSGWSWAL